MGFFARRRKRDAEEISLDEADADASESALISDGPMEHSPSPEQDELPGLTVESFEKGIRTALERVRSEVLGPLSEIDPADQLLLALLDNVRNAAQSSRQTGSSQNGVLVFGRNGVGKSSLINMLMLLTSVTPAKYHPGKEQQLPEGDRRFKTLCGSRESLCDIEPKLVSRWEEGPTERAEPFFSPTDRFESVVNYFNRIGDNVDVDSDGMAKHAFVLPSKSGTHSTTAFCIHLKHGSTFQLRVWYHTEKWAHDIAVASLEPWSDCSDEGTLAAERLERLLAPECFDQMSQVPDGESIDPHLIELDDGIRHFDHLGKCEVFLGRGVDFDLDRAFVKRKLLELTPGANGSSPTKADLQRSLLIQKVELFVPSAMLQDGLELIDSPGTNDSDSVKKTVTREILEKVDTVLMVLTERSLQADKSVFDTLAESSWLQKFAMSEDPDETKRMVICQYADRTGVSVKLANAVESMSRVVRSATTSLDDLVKQTVAKFVSPRSPQLQKDQIAARVRMNTIAVDAFPLIFTCAKLYVPSPSASSPMTLTQLQQILQKSNGLELIGACTWADRLNAASYLHKRISTLVEELWVGRESVIAKFKFDPFSDDGRVQQRTNSVSSVASASSLSSASSASWSIPMSSSSVLPLTVTGVVPSAQSITSSGILSFPPGVSAVECLSYLRNLLDAVTKDLHELSRKQLPAAHRDTFHAEYVVRYVPATFHNALKEAKRNAVERLLGNEFRNQMKEKVLADVEDWRVRQRLPAFNVRKGLQALEKTQSLSSAPFNLKDVILPTAVLKSGIDNNWKGVMQTELEAELKSIFSAETMWTNFLAHCHHLCWVDPSSVAACHLNPILLACVSQSVTGVINQRVAQLVERFFINPRKGRIDNKKVFDLLWPEARLQALDSCANLWDDLRSPEVRRCKEASLLFQRAMETIRLHVPSLVDTALEFFAESAGSHVEIQAQSKAIAVDMRSGASQRSTMKVYRSSLLYCILDAMLTSLKRFLQEAIQQVSPMCACSSCTGDDGQFDSDANCRDTPTVDEDRKTALKAAQDCIDAWPNVLETLRDELDHVSAFAEFMRDRKRAPVALCDMSKSSLSDIEEFVWAEKSRLELHRDGVAASVVTPAPHKRRVPLTVTFAVHKLDWIGSVPVNARNLVKIIDYSSVSSGQHRIHLQPDVFHRELVRHEANVIGTLGARLRSLHARLVTHIGMVPGFGSLLQSLAFAVFQPANSTGGWKAQVNYLLQKMVSDARPPAIEEPGSVGDAFSSAWGMQYYWFVSTVQQHFGSHMQAMSDASAELMKVIAIVLHLFSLQFKVPVALWCPALGDLPWIVVASNCFRKEPREETHFNGRSFVHVAWVGESRFLPIERVEHAVVAQPAATTRIIDDTAMMRPSPNRPIPNSHFSSSK